MEQVLLCLDRGISFALQQLGFSAGSRNLERGGAKVRVGYLYVFTTPALAMTIVYKHVT